MEYVVNGELVEIDQPNESHIEDYANKLKKGENEDGYDDGTI